MRKLPECGAVVSAVYVDDGRRMLKDMYGVGDSVTVVSDESVMARCRVAGGGLVVSVSVDVDVDVDVLGASEVVMTTTGCGMRRISQRR